MSPFSCFWTSMTIQHKDIPDDQLHEPKGAADAANKAVFIADGAGSGSFARLTPADIDNSDPLYNVLGWNDVSDNQYTAGSPRAIASGVRTQLTNNALALQTDTSRLGGLWVPGSSYFLINDLNAYYQVRVTMKVTAAAAASTPHILQLELESANGPSVILGFTQYLKGGGAINNISVPLAFYNGSFINNQSLKVFVTPDTDIEIYNIGFGILKQYSES